MSAHSTTLRQSLDHEPVPLKFGTSGRRGRVADLTQLEVYLNALAELEYLQSLPKSAGGIVPGEAFYFACDLRPSSIAVVETPAPRGGLAHAVSRAIADSGMEPVSLGLLPTPALASFALSRGKGSMMVTGSHIPFDRNGYKTNTALGELLKRDEAPIQARVEQVRARLYSQPAADSRFGPDGMLKDGPRELPPILPEASAAYLRRYTDFFAGQTLRGMRLLVYQHSAVGRDLLVELLRGFGAEVVPAGRSETFVPIDTEAIDAEQLGLIQSLAIEAWKEHGPIDAVVSTDGDSDRPLLLGVEPAAKSDGVPCHVRFFGGDLLGMVVAAYLQADAVVVPISCNDAVDLGPLREVVEPKTRIGSPFVIAGMQHASAAGRRVVCGWEANGGFLLDSTLTREGRTLRELPTRDAFLPLLAVLLRAKAEGVSVSALFDQLPRRFSRAALLKNFPRPTSQRIVAQFSPSDESLKEVAFRQNKVSGRDAAGREIALSPETIAALQGIRSQLETFFTGPLGFGRVVRLNYIDGVRVYFANGDVAHVRPSGNADELRIYAVADTQSRADAIAHSGVSEPDGILRRLERVVNAAAVVEAIGTFRKGPGLVPLEGVVQHYGWGGHKVIPSLLGRPELSQLPCAELWLGGHPNAPSSVMLGGVRMPLTELLAEAGIEVLGPAVARQFGGQFPFLFKVLDARQMLSIQAHPTRQQAAEGFDREEQARVPLKAPTRNYKDRNPKPEVHVALTEFWMLHGFRPLEEIADLLETVTELRPLMPEFRERLQVAAGDDGRRSALLRRLYERAMTLSQAEVDTLLNPLIARLEAAVPGDKDQPDFWVARAAREFPLPDGHRDRGIISIYLLNLVRLQPGQATYQPAGTLHAYLEGANMELMASSDNVLRGGLTPKHVDVPELMRILKFDSGRAPILAGRPVSPTETVYPTPAAEFELSRLELGPELASCDVGGPGPRILLVLEGEVSAVAGDDSSTLKRGEAVLLPHGQKGRFETRTPTALLFQAAMPGKEPRV